MAFGLDSDPLAWGTFGANDKSKKNNTGESSGESAQENGIPAINTSEDSGFIANSWRQKADSANNAGVQKIADTPSAESMSVLDHVQNTVMQRDRFLPGVAQGVLKIISAPGIALEALPQGVRETLHIGGAQRPTTMPDGTRLYGSPRPTEKLFTDKPFTEAAKSVNMKIQNHTDSVVPAPMSEAAKFTATVADSAGEAVPAVAAAVMTGGASAVLTGTALSYGLAGASGFSTEMMEGSGDPVQALIAGGVEAGSEALGGVASKYGGKALSRIADSPIGEGFEEIAGGSAQALLTGEKYSLKDALYDGAVGAAVGGVIGGGSTAVNTLFGAPTTTMNDSAGNIANASETEINNMSDTEINNVSADTFGHSSDLGSIDPYEEFFDTSNDYDDPDIGTIDPYYSPSSWKGSSGDAGGSTDARSNTSVTGTRTATMDPAAFLNELSSNPILVDDATWAQISDVESTIQPSVPESVPEPEPEPELDPQPAVPPTINPGKAPKTTPVHVPEQTPVEVPEQAPVTVPTQTPTQIPTQTPTQVPTQIPTQIPTQVPTQIPTQVPIQIPTQIPTQVPTQVPAATPTSVPQPTPTNVSVQAQAATKEQASEQSTRKKEKNVQSDPSLMGSGATGEVYESTTYNLTFGAGILSSN